MKKISVLITDDHTMLRESVAALLNSDNRFQVIAECGSGEEAISKAWALKPDIIIMDINLPGMNGMQTTFRIKELLPHAKILAMSMHSNPGYVKQMMKAGVMGYVTKNSAAGELITATIEIMAGKKYICGEVKTILSANILEKENPEESVSLSARETELISFIQKGYTSKDIAAELQLSVKTIEAHRYTIFKKLKIRNVAALINYINGNYLLN